MNILKSVKNFMGIGGVKVELTAPGQAAKADGKVSGKVTLTTKSDQHVKEVFVKVVERWTTGRGDEQQTKELELGKVMLTSAEFDIKTGEVKEFSYTCPFQILKSNADQLKEKGGALGALGSVAKFASGERSEYFVEAHADVKGAALDPSDKKAIKLV